MAEIMFIAPYPELADIAFNVCTNDKDVDIKIARMDKAVGIVAEAQENGCQVIISRGVTSWEIKRSAVELPVVDVLIGGYDILRAYYEAREIGVKIGIVDVEEITLGLSSFEEIVKDNLIKYTCQNELEDISKGIEYLKEMGADVVIGKIAMANVARKNGMKSVVITSGYEAVRRAIYEARRVNVIRKQEKRKAEQLKAILNFTYDGILALDKNGKITVFNRVCEQLTGYKADKAIGSYITDVIPKAHCQSLLDTGKPELGEILEIGIAKVVANRVPIIVDNKVEGVVTTFQQVDRLQKMENKVRRKLADRGLAAKYSFQDIMGKSESITNTIKLAQDYSLVDSTVLIYGQTGSGKEMFAHAIHSASKRKNQPFVAINCAAFPESLLESELFGYVEGAFTGAKKGGKAGVFEIAHRGTLFLDEVGEMSPMLQARLLRVIEQGEIMRLGDSSILPIDVRLVAATHRNLSNMVVQNEFREDLYYRINVLSIKVSSLRDRGKDIIMIARKFLKEFCDRQGKDIGIFSLEAERILLQYEWPGNIRELKNAMERISMLTSGKTVEKKDVIKALLLEQSENDLEVFFDKSKKEDMNDLEDNMANMLYKERGLLERQVVLKILRECNGNKTEAAKHLGISRTTLWRKLQEDKH
ncbi:MAG: sigma 54-interacting transcriptional regulator [Eubacteriales bacterium]